MAVDKKSDHVGNHGGTYLDNDGMSKQFTYIDHDIKTKMSKVLDESPSCKEWQKLYDEIEFDNPKIIEYLNHEWGTDYKIITDEILWESYTPLYLLRKLKEII